jgi:V8-like Glu-specific endopeptidase
VPSKLMSAANTKEYEFAHDGATLQGSSGAPILLAKTYELIGMHHASCTTKNEVRLRVVLHSRTVTQSSVE